MKTKIVYNACYGGYCLSQQAVMRYAELKGLKLWPETKLDGILSYSIYWTREPGTEALSYVYDTFDPHSIDRANPIFGRVVVGPVVIDRVYKEPK